MKDNTKSKDELILEIKQLRERVEELSKGSLFEEAEQYKTLGETILDGILIIDFKGVIIYSNESAVRMFGYEKADDGIGLNVFKFLAPEYRWRVIKDLVRVFSGNWGFVAVYKVLTKDGDPFWVETLGRKIKYQGKVAELIILRNVTERREMEEAIENAKHDLEKKVEERTEEINRTNEELQHSVEKVEKLLKGAIDALSSAVEARDRYTAGHQERVAKLACAIGRKMGLPEEQINGLYMASVVHDIGKIRVPAALLSKEGPLLREEYEIIYTHAQCGYDILKTIEFPWPVARIVQQHHEKMDGSGYPLGLSGKNILLEARILAVADVVEAISFPRPYREALGIDYALREIFEKKGNLYDVDVVDACISLFREKKFTFD
ncbi:MAG: HD domain-containing protein [Candidatus Aadella gelida]|nr:HD domain-containing protein [Candidatus Aadella gelida]